MSKLLILLAAFVNLQVSIIVPRQDGKFTLRESEGIFGTSPDEQFHNYIQEMKLTFPDEDELSYRYKVFSDNLERIQELNTRYKEANVEFAVNRFAHLTPQEFKDQYLTLNGDALVRGRAEQVEVDTNIDVPEVVDWRKKGAVTPVKDQGQCGSCWAFSTTGNIEGRWFLAKGKLVSLSEQNLVDCDHVCNGTNNCDAGCMGGMMGNAFDYIIQNKGIDTEASYPYHAEDGTCSFSSKHVGATISKWVELPNDESKIAIYLAENGPISIAVDAEMWQFYSRGILPGAGCGTMLDHGVLLVGYDISSSTVCCVLFLGNLLG
eukprot:TRINITY_DN9528_c0_g1_i1.p1 TRINITY_DN9528_c0_g1~~TRINITY_DN9528_c0_g1_i1.p1  ORF type:complete len:320 (+),score=33.92 TRINITY_DN9528_c0_g1_i1:113-1072(+)